ncbi:crossover junction endodeoxyribonuclease RuvC [Kineococcus indalonis]|uniref:crossover junction endodeoxyribonuclease RuvC n=1 Tax=Kineococcus indalonis TaxID=2696566 RepID=UPI0014129D6B|nr:crossover junction endodeoxyribonuclease RuvC [Kineococcus indalonis]NAZ87494.1 crossover junction endodeoxyribonuclease RuvC [Kineococcus indalonis]
MRVLAVDPGLTRCGLGVVESSGAGAAGRRVRMVAVGVVRTPSEHPVPERLLAVAEGLESWLDEHSPDVVAVERVFAQANVRSVMGTAQAAGLVLVAAARRGLPVAMHTPSEVKAAVTGSGRADKEQVTAMVTRILGLDAPPRPADAADALALALCHLWRGAGTTRLEAAAHSALVTGRRNAYAEAARAAARRPVGRAR